MKKQFAVIGLGRFGSEVAKTLSKQKYDVIAIDKDEARVRSVMDLVSLPMQLDAIDERALREAGVQNVDVAIVSIGEDIEASILVVMILRDLGIKSIIAKAVSDLHGRILALLGVERVVHPERDMAQKIAQSLIRSEILDYIELSPDHSIVEIPVPESIWRTSIMEANLRGKYGITIIAIKGVPDVATGKEPWNINPYPADILKPGDTLVVLGKNKDIEKFNSLR